MKKILLATKNSDKVKEFKAIFAHLDYDIISLKDLEDFDEVKEDGYSFKDNAYIKAKYYYDKYHMPVFSDDSGISIAYLHDLPGVHSARFLGGKDYEFTNSFILEIMQDIQDRRAYYSCVIAYIDEHGPLFFEGILEGEIALAKKGHNGFGFDPIFYLPAYQKTLAELDSDIKNKISHRYIALEKMVKYFEK